MFFILKSTNAREMKMLEKILIIISVINCLSFSQFAPISPPKMPTPNINTHMHYNKTFTDNIMESIAKNIFKSIEESLAGMDLKPKVSCKLNGPVKKLIIVENGIKRKRGENIPIEIKIEEKHFNEKQELCFHLTTDDDYDIDELVVFKFDSSSNLIKKEVYDESFKDLEDTYIYEYSSGDTLTSVKVLDEYDYLDRTYLYKYYKNLTTIIDDEDVEKIYYNNNMEKVKYENWDDGKIDDYTEFFYYPNGKLKEIIKTEIDEDTIKWRTKTVKTYRNNNIIKEYVFDKNDAKILSVSYFYNNDTLTCKEFHNLSSNKVSNFYFSDFDNYGNFTKLRIKENGIEKTRYYKYTYYE